MQQGLKLLLAATGGIAIHIAATAIWESSLFAPWHKDNPISGILSWLSAEIGLSRLSVFAILVWSLAASVFLMVERWPIRIIKAVYFTPQKNKDITERVAHIVKKGGHRSFPVINELLLGTDQDIDKGTPKQLKVEYSKFGRRRPKTIDEFQWLNL